MIRLSCVDCTYLRMIVLLNFADVQYSTDMMCNPFQNYNIYIAVDLTYLRTILLSDKHACVGKVLYIANINVDMLISATDVSIKIRGPK